MFDKIKQAGNLLKMRGEMSQMQKRMKQIKESVSEGDLTVSVLGDGSIDYIKIGDEDRRDLVSLINKAKEKVQKKAAAEMVKEYGLSGLMKGFGN